ncbi:spherulin 1a [Auriscalpium vulgare]|uniref:Spherulin 1a n=1 Tax=Auriscalpium vulgare TaxID=40419 RepID=A0ACB8RS39_9AGAM|nr:spherulin 1a [Auriscalpium vulgare]
MFARFSLVPTHVLLLILSLFSLAHAQSSVAELVGRLRMAASQRARFELLQDSDFVFNFRAPPSGVSTGAGGHTVQASADNFPAVISNGVAMTVGYLDACSMNTPHTHPRATEINFAVNTTLRAGILMENGARYVGLEVPAGSAAVFPQGAIHFEMNLSCEPGMFVAAFNNEDPGVNTITQRYLGLPPDIVAAALGGVNIVKVAHMESKILDNVAFGVDDCLQRCNIKRTAQPTMQRQPRVAANALPKGY